MLKGEADRVFAALEKLGVAMLYAEYSGSGDSGQFDGLHAHNAEGVKIGDVEFDKPLGEIMGIVEVPERVATSLLNQKLKSFSTELEDMAWQAVDDAGENGFWNNDGGGYGKLVFDVSEHTIVLEHSNYTGATEDSSHTVYSVDPNEDAKRDDAKRDAAS